MVDSSSDPQEGLEVNLQTNIKSVTGVEIVRPEEVGGLDLISRSHDRVLREGTDFKRHIVRSVREERPGNEER